MSFNNRFSSLGQPKTIWTVPAIHGDLGRLKTIHHAIYEKFQLGDRLVYLGNYIGGRESASTQTIDEILSFRRDILALPGMLVSDIIYLRGIQEEMWQKLLQLQFAPNPASVFEWMVSQGIESTLTAYGSSIQDGKRAVRDGVMGITKWTNQLRQNIRKHPGHEKFGTVLKRAAFTEGANGKDNLLFVHSGLDPALPLIAQGDSFWWSGHKFTDIHDAYDPFNYVIRGYDPANQGVQLNGVTMSLDGGCGQGGPLVCAQLSNKGEVLTLYEA